MFHFEITARLVCNQHFVIRLIRVGESEVMWGEMAVVHVRSKLCLYKALACEPADVSIYTCTLVLFLRDISLVCREKPVTSLPGGA